MKSCVVVAHPDDETLWAGGFLARYARESVWEVVCCTIPRADPIRADKFLNACGVLGARGIVHPAIEQSAGESLTHLNDIDLSEYDYIMTHNAWGEYGHIHHRNVHSWVLDTYPHKRLGVFGHRSVARGVHSITLTEREQSVKMAALECYNHILPYNGREMTKCAALLERYIDSGEVLFNVETFDGAMP